MANGTSEETPEIVATAHRLYNESRSASSEWREEAHEMYDMVAGTQWSDSDIRVLQEQQRPAVVFNRISRTINAVVGTQVTNRQETRYIPRELGDVQVNEILTSAADWVRDRCDAEDEETDAFEDMCITGMGWSETRICFDVDPEGETLIERVDPLEMYWDPGATKRNLSDARWVMRVRKMAKDDIEAQWPDADISAIGDPWDGPDEDVISKEHVYPQDAYKRQQQIGVEGKGVSRIRVAQFQWSERVTVYRIGEEAQTVSEEVFQKAKKELDAREMPYLKQEVLKWKQAFISGGQLLEQTDSPVPDSSTLKAMTYKRDRNKRIWYGLVRVMKDPQKFGNKFFSQILDILNKGAKGGIMAEKDAFDDPRAAEDNWARADGIIFMRPGSLAGNKVKEKPTVSLPPGLDRLMQFSLEGVHEAAGLNLEQLGFANRQQAGILEAQRKQAGLTIIAPLFDALRRYRKEQGRVLLHFIRTYLSDGRLIKITGQDGTDQYLPLIRQPDTVKYDIIVDESPTSPNMKEKTFAVLTQLLPELIRMGITPPPEVLDYSPLPSALTTKWKEQIQQQAAAAQQGQQGVPPEQIQEMQQQVQAEMQKRDQQIQQLMEENQRLKDKREQAIAEFQQKQYEHQVETGLEREKVTTEAVMDAEQEAVRQNLEERRVDRELALQERRALGEYAIKRRVAELAASDKTNGRGS
jgi:hypothetical protein